jgi:hypothetical protein
MDWRFRRIRFSSLWPLCLCGESFPFLLVALAWFPYNTLRKSPRINLRRIRSSPRRVVWMGRGPGVGEPDCEMCGFDPMIA